MSEFDHYLLKINGKINRWRAFEYLMVILAGLLVLWVLLAAIDVWWRPRFVARIVLASFLPLLFMVTFGFCLKLLNKRRTPAAVAAFLEKHFPQLDNRLINNVLFASESSSSNWLRAYLKEGVPGFSALPLTEIKNRKMRKHTALAIAGAGLCMALPVFFIGDAWTVSLMRVVNPFSTLAPPTFAKVIAVTPADKTIVQGDGINLSVKVEGRAGQFIDIEIEPADDRSTTIRIGQLASNNQPEEFTYRVAKVSSSLQYRFKAGDAYPTEKYTINSVPPLAISDFQLEVTPPAYTGILPYQHNGLTNTITVPFYSEAKVRFRCNRALKYTLCSLDKQEIELTPSADHLTWEGSIALREGGALQITAKDQFELEMHTSFACHVTADAPPNIKLIMPNTPDATLPPNAAPVIQFEATDNFGLSKIQVERVARDAKSASEGEVLHTWELESQRRVVETWSGKVEDLSNNTALRVVAYDNATSDKPGRAISPLISFQSVKLASIMDEENQQRDANRKTIAMLVTQQRNVMATTTRLGKELPGFDEDQWQTTVVQQGDIRALATELLKQRDSAIGTARVALQKAVREPLPEAVYRLTRVASGSSENRNTHCQAALTAQQTVLRLLTQAEDNIKRGEVSQAAAGVLAMLEGILKGQTGNLNVSLRTAKSGGKLPDSIVERQDNLAHDTQAMIGFCQAEAKHTRDDDEFGKLMKVVADKATSLRIHPAMIEVAEIMESSEATRAVPPQHTITNNLITLMGVLKEWRESDTKDKLDETLATIKDSRAALKKMEELQASVVDALRGTGTQGDKTEKLDEDLLEEIVELKSNMAKAMLKVATDLQALPELDAVNELVTDVYQTYEEMAQTESSSTNEVSELGLQKEDWLLDTMMQTGKKMDEMEMWLEPDPDNVQRNMETIDKEEMKGAIGQVTMPEELQDIIGDLLEQEEELEREADDSVTNQGVANAELGWGIAEGETVSYAAAGKSGNERPEHKDQDGRSQVGRQGMSDGEVMSRSGMINEGDKNIERRRTQDSNQSGDVEEEGHSDAVATGGGKSSGYSQEKGMEGDEGATRRDTKVTADSPESTRAQLTRNAEATYAQAQLSNLKTFDLKRYIEFSKQIELLQKQNASPAMIQELHKKAVQALSTTYASLESGISNLDMGSASGSDTLDESVSASPDEAPAEYRDMVSEYFKAIGEL